MRWLGNYFLEILKGPWPEIWWIRHGHGFHQIGYELVEKGHAQSPREGLGVDVPNHLVPLSPLGRWQADETKRLSTIKPDYVYVSQIARAYETAQRIFPGYELKVDPRLNEKDFGPAHMRSWEELMELFPEYMERYYRDGKYFAAKAPGAENYIDLFMKVHSILDTIRRDLASKKVVVVGHSAIMLVVRQLFEHYSPTKLLEIAKEEWIDNCGILHYRHPRHRPWGWRRGKFRLKLEQPPYKLWKLGNGQEMVFWKQAMEELEGLRERFS